MLERTSKIQEAVETIKRNGFWFVDIPRTGSSSIRTELGRLYGPPYAKGNIADPGFKGETGPILDHLSAREMIGLMGRKAWDELFTFSFVRNPWDRAHSLFQYRRKIALDIPADMPFREYLLELARQKEDGGKNAAWYWGYLRSAADYLVDDSGRPCVNVIGRHESRAQGVDTINARLPRPLLDHLRLMETAIDPPPFQSHYDEETRAIVARLFPDDIELFGYAFGDAPAAPRPDALESAKRQLARTEEMLSGEKKRSAELKAWAEGAEAGLASERANSAHLAAWAKRTEALLAAAEKDKAELAAWAKGEAAATDSLRGDMAQLKALAEGAEKDVAEKRRELSEILPRLADAADALAAARAECQSTESGLRAAREDLAASETRLAAVEKTSAQTRERNAMLEERLALAHSLSRQLRWAVLHWTRPHWYGRATGTQEPARESSGGPVPR